MLLIDKYAYINRLKKIHPVEKITLALLLLLFTLLVKDKIVSLLIFSLMSSFTIFAAKIPFSYYIKLLLLPSFFLLSGTLTILFSFAKRDTILPSVLFSVKFRNWQVFISANNVDTVISLLFVVLSSISCLYFLTLTTPVQEILQVLHKLKVPRLLIEITEITYRFIFVFLESALKIYQAQNSRLGYRTARLALHSLGLLISSLFITVFQRAKELTIAMDSRGYVGEVLYLDNHYQYSATNWLIIIGIIAGVMTVYLKFGGNL
jgi:cobalt/nickel transport system permease protein